MKAIIFCAGKGTRLRPLTYFTPKPLINISGKSCLERILDDLESYGITEVVINISYKPMAFMRKLGSRVLYFYEPEALGEQKTLEAIMARFPSFRNDYVVVKNGDTLTNVSITNMMRIGGGASVRHDDNGVYAGTTILAPNSFKEPFSYQDKSAWWVDIGTFKGLARARKIYENKSSSVS